MRARMARRLNAGEILAALGATLLLVSLFMDWYEPGLSSWTVFEIVDLTLAAIAIGTLVGTVGAWFGRDVSARGEHALVFLGAGALIIVAASLIDPPPAASESDPEAGAWLALAGSILMLAGGLLRDLGLSIVVAPREGRHETAAEYDEDVLEPDTETRPLRDTHRR
jgi:peptidoglycan/LPS O-acetylase OafA/YrhL